MNHDLFFLVVAVALFITSGVAIGYLVWGPREHERDSRLRLVAEEISVGGHDGRVVAVGRIPPGVSLDVHQQVAVTPGDGSYEHDMVITGLQSYAPEGVGRWEAASWEYSTTRETADV